MISSAMWVRRPQGKPKCRDGIDLPAPSPSLRPSDLNQVKDLSGVADIEGNDGANTLTGTRREDDIRGRGGSDTLIGRAGDDDLRGMKATIPWPAAPAGTDCAAIAATTC